MSNVTIHLSAIVYDGAQIGEGRYEALYTATA